MLYNVCAYILALLTKSGKLRLHNKESNINGFLCKHEAAYHWITEISTG